MAASETVQVDITPSCEVKVVGGIVFFKGKVAVPNRMTLFFFKVASRCLLPLRLLLKG